MIVGNDPPPWRVGLVFLFGRHLLSRGTDGILRVMTVHPGRVDHDTRQPIRIDATGQVIPSRAGRTGDQRRLISREHVEQTALPHVGSPYNRDEWLVDHRAGGPSRMASPTAHPRSSLTAS